MNKAISLIKAQRRTEMYSYGEPCKHYFETGFIDGKWDLSAAEWTVDSSVTYYNNTIAAPNVTASSFTLPFPSEDVVYNPNLLEPAIEVDVRETYKYDF